jgi:hypothetical protein
MSSAIELAPSASAYEAKRSTVTVIASFSLILRSSVKLATWEDDNGPTPKRSPDIEP